MTAAQALVATSDQPLTIALDAMGGDFSPANEVGGALQAVRERKGRLKVLLVGVREEIELELKRANAMDEPGIELVAASEVIGMEDEPVAALRQKRDSSIVIGFDLVKQGRASAFVSAGNTGAVMSGATLLLGRIPGISRPTIGSMFPRPDGGFTLLFDVGATVDSKAIHLREYAIMGSIYSEQILGIKNPRVGLLSVGEERSKGNELVFGTTELLEKSHVNFAGNVEGRDVFKSTVDVIVCDGFVGNIVLKLAESMLTVMKTIIRNYASRGIWQKLKAAIAASVLRESLKDFDYQEHGGVPLLGVRGVTIIGHGRSTPKALKNMIFKAEEMVEKKIVEKIAHAVEVETVPA
ncbi:MAG: phosphate acyltransferase PlsX [Bacteroidota bacterium]|nr:phosphate acyltransferase PlsX [Bacteroidota bacterium]MDP4234357.1 phosphate acyltransferase PlsX [Bacteroidota bacterium]MDP4287975.1 phosphate acyltransferase PlsX [Bacteroidota bacterium]